MSQFRIELVAAACLAHQLGCPPKVEKLLNTGNLSIARKSDCLRLSRFRLDVNRAKASEALLLLTEIDPLTKVSNIFCILGRLCKTRRNYCRYLFTFRHFNQRTSTVNCHLLRQNFVSNIWNWLKIWKFFRAILSPLSGRRLRLRVSCDLMIWTNASVQMC